MILEIDGFDYDNDPVVYSTVGHYQMDCHLILQQVGSQDHCLVS